ncbi:MAG: ABC transporter substrate-binding protein [Oscillospiraceae bacterium]|nr:ABC transporter substrate-binding protein [Oscillospiraceae bacterium]
MKKRTLALLLALVLALSLCACGDKNAPAPASDAAPSASAEPAPPAGEAQPDAAPEPADTAIEQIVIGTTAAIETAVNGEYAFDMLSSGTTQPPLVWQDADGNYHPLLADYATTDAATWTYTVLDGMKWDDGTPVTAEDILFTLTYEDENGSANLVDQTNSEGKVTKAKYAGYELSADKRSISLTLASPNVRELGNMTSFRVLPKHVYEGKDTLSDAELRIGCGPFVFESFSRDSGTITFVRSETYPQRANVKKLVYQLFDNEDTMYMALQSGDIDMVWAYSTGIAGSYQDVLSGSDKVQLISVNASNAPAVLAFNNANGPFVDENLRHAVALALNYEDFRTYVGSPAADIPNAGFVPTSTVGYKQTAKLSTDAAKAAEYMAVAGYGKNADGKFVDAQGAPFAFTLIFRSDRPNQVSCAELIKTAIDAFGGEVTLEGLDSDSYNAKTSNKFSENNITMEAALYGYTSAGMGMGSGLGTIYVDGRHAVQGGCQVYDEQFQSILAAMSGAKNLDEYIAAAGDMQDFYAAHTPLIGLYWDSMTYGVSSRFENIVVDNAFGLNNVNSWLSITEK